MFDNKTFKKSDEGVSPVIGVILMVAITVVLAAVIGTFVLNLTDNLDQNAQAAVSFDESANTLDDGTDSDTHYDVTATLNNVQSGDSFYLQAPSYSASDTNAAAGNDTWTSDSSNQTSADLTSAGDTGTVTAVDPDDTVNVIGVLEGEESVIQTYDVKGGA